MNKSKFFILIIILIYTSELMSQKIDLDILQGKTSKHLVGDSILLEKETFKAFEKLRNAALNDGLKIKIVSGHRDFERQTLIWNSKFIKFTKEFKLTPKEAIIEIIRFSTVPGTSRHHWGTEIDIIDEEFKNEKNPLISEKYESGGVFNKLKRWMDLNSEKFGFYLTYTNNKLRKGFEYEPWHYSYKPISKNFLSEFKKNNISKLILDLDIMGKEYLTKEFIERYINENILGVNKELKL
tara:strand:+ start:411 stop:1127 length:717 start_codon:yes stop_codon:yes gene_type:complete